MNNSLAEKNIVSMRDVSKIYETNGNQTSGVKNINLSVGYKELLLILGPSGSGKTTLLTLIAGLIKPSNGDVIVFEKNIEAYGKKELQKLRANKIGFIFQTFQLIESLSVLENIMLVQRFAGKEKSDIRSNSLGLLKNST